LGAFLFFIFGTFTEGVDNIVSPFNSNVCGDIWLWMIGFGALIVCTYIIWFAAMKAATVGQMSFIISLGFPINLVAAYIVNGEVPKAEQWIGAAVILMCLVGMNVAAHYRSKKQEELLSPKEPIELSPMDGTRQKDGSFSFTILGRERANAVSVHRWPATTSLAVPSIANRIARFENLATSKAARNNVKRRRGKTIIAFLFDDVDASAEPAFGGFRM